MEATIAGVRTWPRRLWRSSLPGRIVLLTVVSSSLVLLLGGFLLTHLATNGVLESKHSSALAESQTALDIAQSSLRSLAESPMSVDLRLTEVAFAASLRGHVSGQYEVIVQAGAATFQPPLLEGDPVPRPLADQVRETDKLYSSPTMVHYSDGRADVPGLVVGALLEATPGVTYPIYFVFPLANEVHTLDVLQRAVVTTGLLLLLALTGVAFVLARTVVSPVRRAAYTARRIAAGHLDERLPVQGTDDLAVLGRSMNDMAQRLEAQIGRYQELSRVQQRFVSDVSHELRTPLTTVRMAADVLYEGREDLDAISERSVELLHDEVDRFDGLLADLLEISRFDAGAAVLSLDTASLGDVVAREVGAQQRFAASAGVELRCRVEGDTTADMDHRRVQRIIRNLVTNAIEHAEQRPVEVVVAGDQDAVAVTVRDHGVGFAEDQQELVFGRFWRADPSRARRVGGSGLGLSISMEDALLHHGSLQAWGRPGRGAKFRLTLPRTQQRPLASWPLSLEPEGE